MNKENHTGVLVSTEHIVWKIMLLRSQKVMLDTDLAGLYGVTTKRLNQQVKRNISRFPDDFMFQLTIEEKREVVTNCNHLAGLKFSANLPYAFTEHGAIMLASVLNSPTAVGVSVQVVRAFIRLREVLAAHKDLSDKLKTLEKKFERKYRVQDVKLRKIFRAIYALMDASSPLPPPRAGFRQSQ